MALPCWGFRGALGSASERADGPAPETFMAEVCRQHFLVPTVHWTELCQATRLTGMVEERVELVLTKSFFYRLQKSGEFLKEFHNSKHSKFLKRNLKLNPFCVTVQGGDLGQQQLSSTQSCRAPGWWQCCHIKKSSGEVLGAGPGSRTQPLPLTFHWLEPSHRIIHDCKGGRKCILYTRQREEWIFLGG